MEKVKKEKHQCVYCGKSYVDTSFYASNSILYNRTGRLPYCKQCIEKLYQYYTNKYIDEEYPFPERKAVKRLCMIFDVYYKEDVFDSAVKNYKESDINTSIMSQYMRLIQLIQYNRRKETYDNTLMNEELREPSTDVVSVPVILPDKIEVDKKTIDFFGAGFTNEDYDFLKKEYTDWTIRHECNTKAQEEIFKRICFKQLEILRATRRGEDTKNLDATFQNLLDTAKLQPKQNKGDTMADNQTFGTLIDKWENERPLPEIDEELRDVDKIGWYIDVFFRGHLAKMMGLKNGLSNLYTKFINKYTVEKPEYKDEENSEVLFDAIFGNPPSDFDSDSDSDDNKVVM